jgi:hypothetical protein
VVKPLTMTILLSAGLLGASVRGLSSEMPRVETTPDNTGFRLVPSGKPFRPWGFNYDHDAAGRLIEDYWESNWPKIEADVAAMKTLGGNVVRVHLQLAKFLDSPTAVNSRALRRLSKLLELAEREGLYLDVTGLGCYHKRDVPAWYDRLDEQQRWDAQARFWQAVATTCAKSPAIFCYDLMNEPVVPGGRRQAGDWLGPPFAGECFVQFITLDQRGRPRPEIARQWIAHLTRAIRQVDRRHLVTVGLVDWSRDRPGLSSGFVPAKIAPELDFLAVHIYPERGKLDKAVETLRGFAVGKPVVVEETFPLRCSPPELDRFIAKSNAAGWISFYWGKPPAELRGSKTIGDALLLEWLDLFQRRGR